MASSISIKYKKFSKIQQIDGIQTDTIILDQRGLRINGNEGVLHTPQISRAGVLPWHVHFQSKVFGHPQKILLHMLKALFFNETC